MQHATGASLSSWSLTAAGLSCSTTTAGSWFQSPTVLTAYELRSPELGLGQPEIRRCIPLSAHMYEQYAEHNAGYQARIGLRTPKFATAPLLIWNWNYVSQLLNFSLLDILKNHDNKRLNNMEPSSHVNDKSRCFNKKVKYDVIVVDDKRNKKQINNNAINNQEYLQTRIFCCALSVVSK